MKYPASIMAAVLMAAPALARDVPAWTASPQPSWGKTFLFPTNVPTGLGNTTVRQIARVGIGGRRVRVVLSNTYGHRPVTIAGASLARSTGGAQAARGAYPLTFAGKPFVSVAAGTTVTSDPVAADVRAGEDLAVSLYFRKPPSITSFHWDGQNTAYVFPGNQLGASAPTIRGKTTVRLFLAGIVVDAPDARGAVVAMGDSITDGRGATLDRDTRWPDFLAARAASRGIAVVNAGISGARLLSDGMGERAAARLEKDVLMQPGVKTLILLLGINDIAWPCTPFEPHGREPTFEQMTAGYRAIVARAHARKVRVIGATLTPLADALPSTPMAGKYFTPAKDALRRRVNDWMRSSGAFDAVVDFDRALADPTAPNRLAAAFDSGDRLHPGDAGNRAMAEAVDLDTLIGDTK